MNWDAFHRRGDVLNAVITELDARHDGALPWELPGVAQTFRDETDLLSALTLKWQTRLQGLLERALNEEPLDIESAVISAWRSAVAEMPGVRRAIDAGLASQDPTVVHAMRRAQAKERELLALWSGRVSAYQVDEYGATVGAKVEEKARAGFEFPAARAAEPALTFLERLKAAVA